MGDPQTESAAPVDEGVPLTVLTAVTDGDFDVRMPLGWTGVAGKIADGLDDELTTWPAEPPLGASPVRGDGPS